MLVRPDRRDFAFSSEPAGDVIYAVYVVSVRVVAVFFGLEILLGLLGFFGMNRR